MRLNVTRGGCVALAIKKILCSVLISRVSGTFDSINVSIKFSNVHFYVCIVYFTPQTNINDYQNFCDFVESNCNPSSSDLCFGNFNLSNYLRKSFFVFFYNFEL